MSTSIYIASPYTDDDVKVMAARGTQVERLLRECIENIPPEMATFFSPIAHTRHLGMNDPEYAEIWEQLETHMVRIFDALWVYRIPGWEASRGVSHEICLAKQYRMPIIYIEEEATDIRSIISNIMRTKPGLT